MSASTIQKDATIARYARRFVEQILFIDENDPIPAWALDCTHDLYAVGRMGVALWELVFTIHAMETEAELEKEPAADGT